MYENIQLKQFTKLDILLLLGTNKKHLWPNFSFCIQVISHSLSLCLSNLTFFFISFVIITSIQVIYTGSCCLVIPTIYLMICSHLPVESFYSFCPRHPNLFPLHIWFLPFQSCFLSFLANFLSFNLLSQMSIIISLSLLIIFEPLQLLLLSYAY